MSGQLSHADSSGTLGAQGTFSNNPTITYSPVTGGDFETLLLTPIPPLDLFALASSGVSTSVVLSVGLQEFNGVSNPGIGLATRGSDTNPICELMHEGEALREAGRLSLDVETTGKGKDLQRVLFYNFLPGKPTRRSIGRRAAGARTSASTRRASIFGSCLARAAADQARSEW